MAAFDRWEAQCSYSAIAAFNTIDGRFSGRLYDSSRRRITLTVANADDTLTISGRWLGKGDNVKGAGEKVSETSEVEVVR